MKIEMKPVLTCTGIEYKTEIEPLIVMLGEIDLCPQRNEKRNTTWNCDNIGDDCSQCPFAKANQKVIEARQILKDIEVVSK